MRQLCRNHPAMLLCFLSQFALPSTATAQNRTFRLAPAEQTDEAEAMKVCHQSITAVLERTGGFRAVRTGDSLGRPLADGEPAELLIQARVEWYGRERNWSLTVLSEAHGGEQIWADDISSTETDLARSAAVACERLAKNLACDLREPGSAACCEPGADRAPTVNINTGESVSAEAAIAMSDHAGSIAVCDAAPHPVGLWLDGREFGRTTLVRDAPGGASEPTTQIFVGVRPGRKVVTLRAQGYREHRAHLTLKPGEVAELRGIRLRSLTASLQVKLGVPQEAEILVDGRHAGRTGDMLTGVAPGRRRVTVRAPGYRDWTERVAFQADKEVSLNAGNLVPLPARIILTRSTAGAEVVVDQRVIGRTSGGEDSFEVPASSRVLALRGDGFRQRRFRLALSPGGEATFDGALEAETSGDGSGAGPNESGPR